MRRNTHRKLARVTKLTTDPTPNPAAAKTGAYRFTDHSVLRPWVTRVWFARLFPLLPRWLAANIVTLMSTGALASVLVASYYAETIGPVAFALIQLGAMQLYVAGDHLDGMQAVATGTTSPLGDFLDHHCDLWAGCILCYGFWRMTGSNPVWLLPALIMFMILGFAITYVERAERKALHFTAWGTLEAIVIVSVFYLSWCIAPIRAWWMQPLVGDIPRTMLVAGLGMLMAAGAIVIIAGRLTRVPVQLLVFCTSLGSMLYWCFVQEQYFPSFIAWLAVLLVSADYIARVMRAHTTEQPSPWPDFVPLGFLAFAQFSGQAEGAPLLVVTAFIAWLVLRYTYTMTRIVMGWRQHWVWTNARREANS